MASNQNDQNGSHHGPSLSERAQQIITSTMDRTHMNVFMAKALIYESQTNARTMLDLVNLVPIPDIPNDWIEMQRNTINRLGESQNLQLNSTVPAAAEVAAVAVQPTRITRSARQQNNNVPFTTRYRCTERGCIEMGFREISLLEDHLMRVHKIGAFRCFQTNCRQNFSAVDL